MMKDELDARRATGLVLFGHRYRQTLTQWENLTFVEAPNVRPLSLTQFRRLLLVAPSSVSAWRAT
jgi:hypothetical protein